MVWETKIDESLPIGNFVIDDYSTPYILDRNSNGGRTLLDIRDTPLYLIATEKEPVESFYVELNLHNKKYLINCFYNPRNTMTSNHGNIRKVFRFAFLKK